MNRSTPAVNTAPRRAALLARLERLQREVAELYVELAPLLADASVEYSSTALPAGVTRRAFRELCASGRVEGATREGHVWRCSRSAWHGARRAPRKPTPAAIARDEVIDVDALIDAAPSLRATRKSA